MWNVMSNYYKNNIVLYKDKEDCWLNMPRQSSMVTGLTTFDSKYLAFLLTCGKVEAENLYSQIFLEEQNFGETIKDIEEHSDLLRKALSKFARVGIMAGRGPQLDEDLIEQILGVDDVHLLKVLTKSIIKRVEENRNSLIETRDNLKKVMESLYPKEKFISFEPNLQADSPQ